MLDKKFINCKKFMKGRDEMSKRKTVFKVAISISAFLTSIAVAVAPNIYVGIFLGASIILLAFSDEIDNIMGP